jgi:DNA-binding MarR family transcriptional regulator/N-acetylglutamate synthase-like GNAT family acetyltransferase
MMPAPDRSRELDTRIAAVRGFNRFYTERIGVLQEGLLATPFSLTEARVLYELAQRDDLTATTLCRELGLDAGYLSRMLAGFVRVGMVAKRTSAADGRQSLLKLTAKGRKAFAPLDARSREQIAGLLDTLSDAAQERLLRSMHTIERMLGQGGEAEAEVPYTFRAHRPGDIGWVVHRHGVLYAREYGWDERFEALVAGIVAEFVQRFDAARERCWIAERDGDVVGSVFLVRHSDEVAKLRLLLVEPSARGFGLGGRLVEECIAFARGCGYRMLSLWTNNNLLAARRIYARAGFRCVKEEPHASFGHPLVGETWELAL